MDMYITECLDKENMQNSDNLWFTRHKRPMHYEPDIEGFFQLTFIVDGNHLETSNI